MKKAAKRTRGFTIAEILIAIAVITIAMLGTIAAIAFGLRAARVGGDDSVAVSINRKIIELVLQNQFAPSNSMFNHGPADPTVARGTAPWRPLYQDSNGIPAGWFTLADYGYTAGTADAQRFINDTQGYEIDVSCQRNPGGSSSQLAVSQAFYEIIVTTRWQDKNRWRSLQTRAYSVSAGY